MTPTEVQDLLLRVETAMHREGIDGWQINRVVNTLIAGHPDGGGAVLRGDEIRVDRLQRALAQAKTHERAIDQLQSELRAAGEAYAYSRALEVRDAATDLVKQLREDLGDQDPDLITGVVVHDDQPDDTFERYHLAREALAANLRHMMGALDGASAWDGPLHNTAEVLAQQLEAPRPFTPGPFRREPSTACYEASWGWVHSRPSCRCPRWASGSIDSARTIQRPSWDTAIEFVGRASTFMPSVWNTVTQASAWARVCVLTKTLVSATRS